MRNPNQQQLFNTAPTIYKTEHFKPAEVESLEKNAVNQEIRILRFLRQYSGCGWGASQIWVEVRTANEPITSIRRALTNLERRGLVVKLRETVTGLWNKQERLWRVK